MNKPSPKPHTAGHARRLREAMRRLMLAHGALDGARRPCGSPLPMPHAYALIELLQAGPMTISDLAELLNIDRTNVSRLCARMESDGELRRQPHPEDGRARLVQLTPKGKRLAQSVDAASTAHFERVLASMNPDPDQTVETLVELATALRLNSTNSSPD